MLVGAGGDFVELLRGKERRAAIAGEAGVIVEHQGGHGFEHAIHEDFHAAGMQHVALILVAHFNRFIDAGGFEIILLVEGHLDAGDELILVHERLQQLKLIPVAVHVVDGGDAEGGAVFQPALHEILVDEALGGGGRRHGIFAGDHAEPFAPAGGGEVQAAGAKAAASRSSPVASPSLPMTISLPGVRLAPWRRFAASSALVLAQTVWWSKQMSARGRSAMMRVQNLAGDGRGVAQRHGGGAIDDDDALLRVGRGIFTYRCRYG